MGICTMVVPYHSLLDWAIETMLRRSLKWVHLDRGWPKILNYSKAPRRGNQQTNDNHTISLCVIFSDKHYI